MRFIPRVMAALRFRGFIFFTRMWILPNRIGENANSYSSLLVFLKELAKFDRGFHRPALLDLGTMARFTFYGPPAYVFLKKIYRYDRGPIFLVIGDGRRNGS